VKRSLIRYFFYGNSLTNDGYLRVLYLFARFLFFLPISIVASFVLGIISLFRPVKILLLRCERSKVSFIIEDLELSLRIESFNSKNRGSKKPLTFAVLDCESPNLALTQMYDRVVPFFDDQKPVLRGILRYVLPILQIRRQYGPKKNSNRLAIWSNEAPTLSFTNAEIAAGAAIERQLFGEKKAQYVCLGIAESTYYQTKHLNEHDVDAQTDLYSCMPEIESYFDCSKFLTTQGIQTIRMGQFVESPLKDSAREDLIDYATTMRSEFGDVWLLSNCKFVVAGGTGVYWISSAMNLPTVLTDSYSSYNTTFGPNDLVLPQLAKSKRTNKLLPFKWIIENREWAQNRKLIENEVEIIKNTPQEITEVVSEMNERIDQKWQESNEDIELQNRFRELIKTIVPEWRIQPGVRIGAAFLRRHKELL